MAWRDTKTVRIAKAPELWGHCDDCYGKGTEPQGFAATSPPQACHTCKGSGIMRTHIELAEGGHQDAWRCVCNNTPSDYGFFPSDERGVEEDEPDDNWDGVHYTCDKCGRTIDGGTGEIKGMRTIARVAQVAPGVSKRDLNIPTSPHLDAVLGKLHAKGHKALVVGGAVRDALLGEEPKDVDVEVYGTSYDELADTLKPHGKVNQVGKAFGVVKFTDHDKNEYDFSLPRRDNKTGVGHKDFKTEFDPEIQPREAAGRRDFTFNSLAYDPINKELHDYHGGEQDLKDKVIRHTSDQFAEDPLRVLRGMQFSARYGMTVHPDTAKLAKSISHEYSTIPKERVSEEFMKLSTKGKEPGRAMAYLQETGWSENFPQLHVMKGTPQDKEWHPEGDLHEHTKHAMNAAAKIADREGLAGDDRATVVFGAMLHDVGKPDKTDTTGERVTSHGHDSHGEQISRDFLGSIGVKKDISDRVAPLVREHMQHLNYGKGPSSRTVRRLADRLHPATIKELGHVMEADHSARPPLEGGLPKGAQNMLDKASESNVTEKKQDRLVNGRDVMPYFKDEPGPHIGEHVNAAYQAQLDGEFDTHEQGKAWLHDRMTKKSRFEPGLSDDDAEKMRTVRHDVYEGEDPQAQPFHKQLVCGETAQAVESKTGWAQEYGEYWGDEVRPSEGVGSGVKVNLRKSWDQAKRAGHSHMDGYGHYWNRKPDGTIIDASSDQFKGGEGVRVIPPDDPRQKDYWTETTGTDHDCKDCSEEEYPSFTSLSWGEGHPAHDFNKGRQKDAHVVDSKDHVADFLRKQQAGVKEVPYDELPHESQMAIHTYTHHGATGDMSGFDDPQGADRHMRSYKYGHTTIPTEELAHHIQEHEPESQGWSADTFKVDHDRGPGKGTGNKDPNSTWSIIINKPEQNPFDTVIDDGWNRFAHYRKRGLTEVPATWYGKRYSRPVSKGPATSCHLCEDGNWWKMGERIGATYCKGSGLSSIREASKYVACPDCHAQGQKSKFFDPHLFKGDTDRCEGSYTMRNTGRTYHCGELRGAFIHNNNKCSTCGGSGIWKSGSWRDVRNKAVRLRNANMVEFTRLDSDVIAADVQGDHAVYQVVLYRQFPDSMAITTWECSCEWGSWAFRRQHTYVGRFCSHALATLYAAHGKEYTKEPTMASRVGHEDGGTGPEISDDEDLENPKFHHHKMWHVSPSTNRASIESEGLRSGSYAFSDLEYAQDFQKHYRAQDGPENDLYEVDARETHQFPDEQWVEVEGKFNDWAHVVEAVPPHKVKRIGGVKTAQVSAKRGKLTFYGANRPITISVEVSRDATSITQGLMNRQYLGSREGMVFAYPYPPSHSSFWMMNTLIPLSIAFWDKEGRIIEVKDMEPCPPGTSNCPLYKCSQPYWGAVEVNKGFFSQWGIRAGDRVELQL